MDEFDENSDGFWIDEAVHYGQHARNKATAIEYLEDVVTDYDRFWVLRGTLGAAASYLGKMTAYPNPRLAQVMEMNLSGLDEVEREAARLLRCSAYGAYIMTATNFDTGLEAGRSLKASDDLPTVAMAEEFIKTWPKNFVKSP